MVVKKEPIHVKPKRARTHLIQREPRVVEAFINWTGTPVMCLLKASAGAIEEELLGDAKDVVHAYERNPTENGASKENIYAEFVRLFPWAAEYIRNLYGAEITPHKVAERARKQFQNNGKAGVGGTYCIAGVEHYTNSKKLKPYGPYALLIVKKYKKPTTFTKVNRDCSAISLT